MKPTTINTNFNSIPTNSNNLDTGKSKESIIKLPIIQDNKVNEIINTNEKIILENKSNNINVSNIIGVDNSVIDDQLLNTKDDPLLTSVINDRYDDTNNNITNISAFNNKQEIKLEFEEILEDRFNNFVKYF